MAGRTGELEVNVKEHRVSIWSNEYVLVLNSSGQGFKICEYTKNY